MVKSKINYTRRKAVIFFIVFGIAGYLFLSALNQTIHSNAEKYHFAIPRTNLINQIDLFKKSNPSYQVITTNEKGEKVSQQDRWGLGPLYYYSNFYLEDKDLTLSCLILEKDRNSSTLALRSVSKGVDSRSWKDINTKELTKEENKNIIMAFEGEILPKLGYQKPSPWWKIW